MTKPLIYLLTLGNICSFVHRFSCDRTISNNITINSGDKCQICIVDKQCFQLFNSFKLMALFFSSFNWMIRCLVYPTKVYNNIPLISIIHVIGSLESIKASASLSSSIYLQKGHPKIAATSLSLGIWALEWYSSNIARHIETYRYTRIYLLTISELHFIRE